MNKKQKKNLIRIIISAALLIILHFVKAEGWLRFALYMVPYLIIGYDIILKAFKGIKNRQPFDECLLMVIATVGAIVLALLWSGDYVEAVAVMLFYQVGEWFQSVAVGKSRRSISDMMDIRPDHANVETENGTEEVDPDEVEPGTMILVKPGERIPIDGVIEEGTSSLDTSALTGESVPREVTAGDEVISGCINQSAVLRIRTTKEFGDSTVSRILDLVENASSRKSRSEDFISRFARVYTPAVVGAALLLMLLPPLARILILGKAAMWHTWVYRALTFLVISCPCALVISIPLSFFAGIGGASREGVLVKGSNYLEQLSEADTVVFDKTGTLTKGSFEVTLLHPDRTVEHELLHLAAHVERYSTHPIAASLRNAFPDEQLHDCTVEDVQEIAGHGVTAMVNGKRIAVGNEKLMAREGAEWKACDEAGTILHVAEDGKYLGHIHISDVEKPSAKDAVRELGRAGVKRIVMLTGDNEKTAGRVAGNLGIREFRSGLLPADKVEEVERLLAEKKGRGRLIFVGDGINDAPVLTRADIGIAMGAMGSDAAIEAADVVLMDDDPLKIVKALKISRKCIRIVKENIWFAIGVKLICLLLGALGIANMWIAIFADVGVMILAVLNAIRALFVKKL